MNTPIWFLERSDWKSAFITSSALWLIMISMLPLFEFITHFWLLSLEKIKLIAIVNLIFKVSDFWDYLWCLLNMA